MTTNPLQIQGAWRLGWTLDVHTTSSEFIGYDQNGTAQFETIRSPLGELLFQLKYRGQTRAASDIAAVMADFLKDKPNLLARTDLIVPVPPSTNRAVQPVAEIARELGGRLQKTTSMNVVRKSRETPGLKNIHDAEERRELLDGAFAVDVSQIAGKGVLLVDDLYRSGATANTVATAFIGAGASRVYFLAVTRTRSHA